MTCPMKISLAALSDTFFFLDRSGVKFFFWETPRNDPVNLKKNKCPKTGVCTGMVLQKTRSGESRYGMYLNFKCTCDLLCVYSMIHMDSMLGVNLDVLETYARRGVSFQNVQIHPAFAHMAVFEWR